MEKNHFELILSLINDKVQLILSDGLKSIPENSADDIVMAGMGGMGMM